jgi:hypothetical protein
MKNLTLKRVGLIKLQKIVAEAIYLFLITFFCYTTSNKIVYLTSFKTNLIKTTLFSRELADVFSVSIIFMEVLIILILIFYKKLGLLLFCFTILIFTVYISYLRHKGLYEVCGCGGLLNGLKYQYHLAINIGLIIGSLFSFFTINNYTDEK